MSHELAFVQGSDGDPFAYRSRHAGRILSRIFGLPFIAIPGWFVYMFIFHRDFEFGRAVDFPGWLQVLVVVIFGTMILLLGLVGLYFTLGVRGFDIDRKAGTIEEFSGLIVAWRRTSRRIDDFRAIAVRPEEGVKSTTVHALYLVARKGKDVYIDAWDRNESEIEASRLSRLLGLAVEP